MGTGRFYGHTAILLKGKSLTKAQEAKRVREAKYGAVKLADITASHYYQSGKRLCPACLKVMTSKTHEHLHPEDDEIFEVQTIPVELRIVQPGSTKRAWNKREKEKQTDGK